MAPMTPVFPKQWHCSDLFLSDHTALGAGVLSLSNKGRLVLEVNRSGPLTLGHGGLTITGMTDGGEAVTASLCAVTRTGDLAGC